MYFKTKYVMMIGLLLCAFSLQANTVTFNFTKTFQGGTGDWLTATFTDIGTNRVQLTLKAVNLSGSIDEVYFNFEPFQTLSYTHTGLTASVEVGENEFKADGDGSYDLLLKYSNSTFTGNTAESVYTFTGNGLDARDFNFLSQPPSGGAGPFYAAAHITGASRTDGSWITTNGAPIVRTPEAGFYGSLLIGLVGFLPVMIRRRKQ